MHWNQAEHNREIAHRLLSMVPPVKDWTIIVTFYAALHYYEARLAYEDRHSDGEKEPHKFRKRQAKKYLGEDGGRIYRKLYRLSQLLRYLCAGNDRVKSAAATWLRSAR